MVFCFTAALLCNPAFFPPAVKAQNGLYEWLDTVSYTPEYDFSNTSLSFYAKEENIALSNRGFLLFDGNTLSVRRNSSASIGGSAYLGDEYGLAGGTVSFDALVEPGSQLTAGVRCISPNADPYDKGIFFTFTDGAVILSIPSADYTLTLGGGVDLASAKKIEIRDSVDEIALLIEGAPYASVLYQENGSLRVVDAAGNSLGGLEETGVYAAGYWNIELERGESTVWIDNLKFHYTQISQALPEREQREVSYRNWVATDDLGRTTAMGSQTSAPKEQKYVGIFYFLCVTGAGIHVQDNTKIYLESGVDGLKNYLKQNGGEAY